MCIRDSLNYLLITGKERQNVDKAAELLSGTVTAATSYLPPGQGHVVEIVQNVSGAFDVIMIIIYIYISYIILLIR